MPADAAIPEPLEAEVIFPFSCLLLPEAERHWTRGKMEQELRSGLWTGNAPRPERCSTSMRWLARSASPKLLLIRRLEAEFLNSSITPTRPGAEALQGRYALVNETSKKGDPAALA